MLACAIPFLLLHAQQTAAPPAQPVQNMAPQPGQEPAQPAASQQPAQGSDQSDNGAPTIRLPVSEVNLIFTVTDKHGHYIPNLKQSDFALLDDQKAPARVNSFRQ